MTLPPRLLIAMDSFKGTMTARQACEAVADGVAAGWPTAEWILVPLADGGAGTVEALLRARGGTERRTQVTGPLGDSVMAGWGLLADGRTAVLEMAAACGLALVAPGRRNPLEATSRGIGELLVAAIDAGARGVVLGIGDTATVDGGLGAAQALGVRFFDASGEELAAPLRGRDLERVAALDATAARQRFAGVELEVLCDVTNPLLGPRGAARVFGPQKGANPAMVEHLEAGLTRVAVLFESAAGTAVRDVAGAGAAGGMGACCLALLGGRLVPGTQTLFDLLGFGQALERADALLTGEGRLDAQSAAGKGAGRALQCARAAGVPAWAFVGIASEDFDATHELGVRGLVVLAPDGASPSADEAPLVLCEAARQWAERMAQEGIGSKTSKQR
ncbi:MAG: glycerate kinase [Candidatus Sumerlaeia bacterium]|nr:glycerate kinase [Candidatus Sumerlaeia bacterium]